MKKASKGLLWASTILSLALPAVASAQTASTATAAASSDTVVVTARRREESQQDVPLAVSVLGAQQLERAGVTDINSLAGKVPNLVIVPGQGSGLTTPVIAIRGLSQQDLTHLSDPSVSLYLNDIVVPRPIGGNLAFFDISSVQVLRGPQGTLFGRNTPGGAILVTPQGPTSAFEANIGQTIANYDTFSTEAMVNLPLGDQAALRIAGIHNESGGYITDVNTNGEINTTNENAARVSLDVHPTADWDFLTTANYAKADDGGTGAFALPGSIGGAAQATRNHFHTASGVPQHSNVEIFSLDNHATWNISDSLTLRNIVGWRNLKNNTLEDTDGSASFILPIQRLTTQEQISEEVQLLGDASWGNWIVGGFYFKETGDDQGLSAGTFAGGGVDPGLIEPNTDLRNYSIYSNTWSTAENTSTAIFAQATVKLDNLLNGLSLTAGARESWDERDAVIKNRTRTACRFTVDADHNTATPEVNPGLAGCALPLSADFSEPTYNLSLDWHVTNDLLLYAATRHGYRTGGFGARASTQFGLQRTFNPETVDDVEVGIKADWHPMDMFLRTNLAVFHADYTDIQRLLTDTTTTPVTTVTANAGEATIDGAELEWIFRPMHWLEFSGFWAYTDADFTKFISFDGTDLSNAPFARAPRNIESATVRVTLPTPESIGDASLGVTFFHQDRYSGNDNFNPATSWQEAYDLVNFTGELTNAFGSRADLEVFVNNAFDNDYKTSILAIGAATVNSAVAGEPRTYGLRLKYHFGE